MPRLIPISDADAPALLALRRTLWQFAILGIAAAATLARIAPQSGTLALWCVLVPLSALAAHFRHALLNLLRSHRHADAEQRAPRRAQRPQARRARADGTAARLRRQPRARQPRDPAQAGPRAR